MSNFKPIDELDEDRRKSVRCAVQAADETAILKTKRKALSVRIVEKSAGGFGIVAPVKAPIVLGQVLSFTTAMGTFEVRVAHVTTAEGELRVGLTHLRDVSGKQPVRPASSARSGGVVSRSARMIRLAILGGVCLAMVGCGLMVPGSAWRDLYGRVRGTPAAASRFAAWPVQRREQKLAEGFVNLDGLKSPRFLKALNLSGEQHTKIRSVVQETTDTLSQLYAQKDAGQADAWSDQGLQLIIQSYERIQNELTDEQKARWHQLAKGK